MSESGDPLKSIRPVERDSHVHESPATPEIDVTLDSSQAPTAVAPPVAPEAQTIGRYRLIRKLGEGGMGQVWLAEQTEPVRRSVAFKLIRVGVYDDEVLRRFESERQSLARMDHPGIAKVFDAGATRDGQPYFVMEYVPGRPIIEYCDQKRLSIRARLKLFVQVCEGVQHAHQKAVIHRDLKPANILVAEVDGKPLPRIIDFGLAKATTASLDGDTMLTRAGAFVGTPGFMSPEQATSMQDIDTRTDVYSLGIVLYVLLTGSLPIDLRDFRQKPVHEVLRHLSESEAPKPSTKVTAIGEPSAHAERCGLADTKQLRTLISGDLDWITLKAMEKDRDRRYSTPSDLAADICRYLNHEPIAARPASTAYRLQKYARRHRLAVGVAGMMLIVLVAFAAAQAVQLRRVQRERDRANRVTDFMSSMFRISDPSEARGNNVTARELLDSASTKIDSELKDDPELRAQMMETMGNVCRNLGLYSRAQSLFEHTVQIRHQVLGPEDAATLNARRNLAEDLTQQGRPADAEKMARETLAIQRRVLGVAHRDALRSMQDLIFTLSEQGKLTEAEQMGRDGLQLAQRSLAANDEIRIAMMNNLGLVLQGQGKYPEAEQIFRDGVETMRRDKGPDYPNTLKMMANLSWALQAQNRYAEVEQLQRQTLESEQRVFGPEHPEYLRSMNLFGRTLRHLGRYNEAEKIHLQVLEVQRRILKPGSPNLSWTLENLGFARNMGGHYSEAREFFLEAIANAKLGQSQPAVALARYNFACAAALAGQTDEALHNLQEALAEHYGGAEIIAKDEDLRSLHGNPGFEQMISDLRQREAAKQETMPK